jgi:hypothetical protein
MQGLSHSSFAGNGCAAQARLSEGIPVSSAFCLPGSLFAVGIPPSADWRRVGTIVVFREVVAALQLRDGEDPV